ncbi:ATP-binding protein [Pedobacter glucosidilyticus]|uniref:ATP-binding protein n=1 Tax=Pedobacter glucosidilyticus TaxID=1122941 RepID=UPI00040194E0|nr:ATP-binding protein [Pedobacter glucosidilyticus]
MLETNYIEYKSDWKDDYLKVICAFANTSGGILYVGKNDDGKSVGISNAKDLLENLPNKINSRLGIITDISFDNKDGLEILIIEIKKSTVPISFNGKYYKRSGSVVLELQGRQLSDFLLKHTGYTWDMLDEDHVSMDDLNLTTIDKFKSYASDRLPSIYLEENLEILLQKLNLLNKKNLSRAAILLFSGQLQKYFPQAHIKIGRFVSPTEMISSDIITGNLFQQLEDVFEVLQKKYLIHQISYDGIHRREIPAYPLEALREALINALIHRNYHSTAATQVRIYNHYIQIVNDGRLPEGMSISDLKKPHLSYPRHILLADVFYKAGFIESWGNGTLKISEICSKMGLPEVLFEQNEYQFSVTIFAKSFINEHENEHENEYENEHENERLKSLILEIKKNKFISINQLAEKLGVNRSTVTRDLNKLKEARQLNRKGSAKGGYWEVNHE